MNSTAGAPAVFISYARKDYYFAESLAFHLQHRGVPVWFDAKDLQPGGCWDEEIEAALNSAPCVLLVASPEAINRPYVRAEWEKGRAQGKRIVIALFRSTRLPEVLDDCEVVDFRGAFQPALDRLVRALVSGPVAARVNTTRSLQLPPGVWFAWFALSFPLASILSLARWRDDDTPLLASAVGILIGVSLFGWLFSVAFLRRRMGMTYLMVSLALTGSFLGYQLLSYGFGYLTAVDPRNAYGVAVRDHLKWVETSVGCSLAGLMVLLLGRPDDILRWVPTGTAWSWYRRRSIARTDAPDQASVLARITTYQLLHDDGERPLADRFRKEMTALGATEADGQAAAQTAILLLSSRTRTQWLAASHERLPSDALIVVGSHIGLPSSLEWLWRREWIDFRLWDLEKLARRRGLLQVPEAVTRFRYPAAVRVCHQCLCFLSSLIFLSVYALDPNLSRSNNDPSVGDETVGLLFFGVWLACFLSAHRLLKRTLSQQRFLQLWWLSFSLAAALYVLGIQQVAARHGTWWRMVLPIPFLIAAPFVMRIYAARAAFWFPEGAGKTSKEDRLSPGRNWQTAIWVMVYLAVVGLLTGAFDS